MQRSVVSSSLLLQQSKCRFWRQPASRCRLQNGQRMDG